MTSSEFTRLARKFESLVAQVKDSNTHLYLYKQLRDAERNEFESVFHKSKHFWEYTLRAHLKAALSGLCRVYDVHKADAFHLLRFVENIQNGKLVDEEKLTDKQRERSLKKLTSNEEELLGNDVAFLRKERNGLLPDPKVQKLRTLRDKFIAHRDLQVVFADPQTVLGEFTVDEMQMLVDEAFAILERWKFFYRPDYQAIPEEHRAKMRLERFVYGKDDYVFVLESIRRALALKDSKELRSGVSGK